MDGTARPYRSVLYIPASKPRALQKAREVACDAIIFDLEDAVAPGEKEAARDTLAATLAEGGYGRRARLVRVNGPETPWHRADLDAAAAMAPDAVLLPKVGGAADVARAREALADLALWAMIETPAGVLAAGEIARAPGMTGFVMGTNDLVKELGCREVPDRMPLMVALQTALLAARAAGIVCVDGVYNAYKDEAGLRAECEQGRDLGMDGKSLIHPAQVAIANEVFAPTEAAVDLARRQIAAFEEAQGRGEGVAVVNGRIVENLHFETARKTLARAEAIAAMERA